MKLSETMALFNKIRNNLPNGFYQDIHGNYCLTIDKYMIIIYIDYVNYSQPAVEIDLSSCRFGCFDNLLDWYIINKVEDVEKYIVQFIDYIKER